MWPEIARLAKLEIQRIEAESTEHQSVIVLEAAVLIEAGWQSLVDRIWVTVVPPSVAQERLMRRNNLTAEEALKRINSQLSNEERTKQANVTLDNSKDLESCLVAVREAWKTK